MLNRRGSMIHDAGDTPVIRDMSATIPRGEVARLRTTSPDSRLVTDSQEAEPWGNS
jgi:hypothetical protein